MKTSASEKRLIVVVVVVVVFFLRDLVKSNFNRTWGPFLETPDNFPGPVSIFSSSFIYQLVVIIGAHLVICSRILLVKMKF